MQSTSLIRWPFRAVMVLVVWWAPVTLLAAPRNVIVIQTDEHHFRTLGCYGGKVVKTPHIDWIAQRGARCTSFYATTPVCSPSRAALVSGLYPHKTRVTKNDIPLDGKVVTFAELLRRRGYATGFAGKWHLDGEGKPQWAPARKFGFEDNRFMFNRGHWKKFADTPQGPRVASRNKRGQPSYGVDGADEKSFSTDWLCDKVVQFIQQHKDRPFCYMVSLPDPHGPNTVRAPYDTMFADVEVPLPTTFRRQAAQIPGWGKPAGIRPAQLQTLMRAYYGMVKCIDDNVGKILRTLRENNLLEETVVVFTSDHGDLCGEHGRLNKGVPYEGSARIPFLIYAAGSIPEGVVVPEALTCIDFLPTLMELLEIPVPHAVDGRSAVPLFRGQRDGWEDFAVVRSTAGRQVWLGGVTRQYKLVYSVADEPWLFDIEKDPAEVTNLATDPDHQHTMRQLTAALLSYAQAHQDPYLRVPAIRQHVDRVIQSTANLRETR